MGLRFWGIALLVVGIVVLGTGVLAALSAREMWQASDARCAATPGDRCGASETLAAAFLLVLGPLGVIIGSLVALAGAILVAIGRRVERGIQALKERALAALATTLD